jgi:hypothetical protein
MKGISRYPDRRKVCKTLSFVEIGKVFLLLFENLAVNKTVLQPKNVFLISDSIDVTMITVRLGTDYAPISC